MPKVTPSPYGISDQEFRAALEQYGPIRAAQVLGIGLRGLYKRRRSIENRENLAIIGPEHSGSNSDIFAYSEHSGRQKRKVKNGVVIAAGDCHYEPALVTVMHRALVWLCKELKPIGVVLNGDVCDFARLSQYPKISFSDQPHSIKDEISAAQDRVHEITMAAGGGFKDWPLGNHDKRFNQAIARLAEDQKGREYVQLNGRTLRDYFPLWTPCWAVWINENTPGFTIIQHRSRGGEHGSYRNAKELHCNYVTGHDHHPYVRGYTSAVGTVYGVNHGMIADKEQQIFVNYTEAKPMNWRSAVAVLTFTDGRLMPPELCEKLDDKSVWFRGKRIDV